MKEGSFSLLAPPESSATSLFYLMAYGVISLLVYSYAAHQLTLDEKPLQELCYQLSSERDVLRKENKELSEMVASLADPAADEYALITELGRIPKESFKIVFATKVHSPKPEERELFAESSEKKQ